MSSRLRTPTWSIVPPVSVGPWVLDPIHGFAGFIVVEYSRAEAHRLPQHREHFAVASTALLNSSPAAAGQPPQGELRFKSSAQSATHARNPQLCTNTNILV